MLQSFFMLARLACFFTTHNHPGLLEYSTRENLERLFSKQLLTRAPAVVLYRFPMCWLLWWYGQLFSFLKNNEWIALWVEGLALVAIFIWDRIDAKDTHEQAANQLAVFQDQVEAMHRPFVSYLSIALSEDVILESENKAMTEIHCPGGRAQIKNYGSGPAINIRYALTPTNPASSTARPKGYLAALRPEIEFRTLIALDLLQGNEWETVITYESLSGRRYQTKVISNNLVMMQITVT